MTRTLPTLAEQSVARVKGWLASQIERRHQIALEAGVNEKTIRLSVSAKWDPKASTLRKLEAVIPSKSKKRRSA